MSPYRENKKSKCVCGCVGVWVWYKISRISNTWSILILHLVLKCSQDISSSIRVVFSGISEFWNSFLKPCFSVAYNSALITEINFSFIQPPFSLYVRK